MGVFLAHESNVTIGYCDTHRGEQVPIPEDAPILETHIAIGFVITEQPEMKETLCGHAIQVGLRHLHQVARVKTHD